MEFESTTSGATSQRSDRLSYGHSAEGGSRTHNGTRFELVYCTIRKPPRVRAKGARLKTYTNYSIFKVPRIVEDSNP